MGKNLKYWLSLSAFPKFGAIRLTKLWEVFHSPQVAWETSADELEKVGLSPDLVREFLAYKNKTNPDQLVELLAKNKISAITLEDDDYPQLLRSIFPAPPVLYYQGQIAIANTTCLAVVGSRKNTTYGQQAISQLLIGLAGSPITIVSGLAFGVDALAHQTALKNSLNTIAVLGSGLVRTKIYPQANLRLADEIISNGGLLLSEFPPEQAPLKQNFPLRNRIISGLSEATLIIEAQSKSGSLITASLALEQGRDVLAVPGGIFSPQSSGCNELIRDGARPIICAQDLSDYFGLAQKKAGSPKITKLDDEEEKIIFTLLSREPIHINDLIRTSRLSASRVNSILAILEIKGLAQGNNGQYMLA